MRHGLRASALMAAAALTFTTFGPAAPASAAPEDRSVGWLQDQLTDGLVHNDQFDFDDYGLTVDVGLAMVGEDDPTLITIREALAEHVDSYTTGVDFGSSDVYAGAVAKLTAFAHQSGAAPRQYGGVDLVKRLNGLISADERIEGRLQDRAADDFANTIGQSFAVLALGNEGSKKFGAALDFLLKQQCRQGYFRLTFAAPGRKAQGCDAAKKEDRAPDTDVTALAVLNLRETEKKTKRSKRAVNAAVAWLERRQKQDGSFGGGPTTDASNANSTGLAAWVLGEVGSCREAAKAAKWVRDLQVPADASGTPLEGEEGAIAYDAAAMAAGQTDGITVETQDQWRRATAQASQGLEFTSVKRCRR